MSVATAPKAKLNRPSRQGRAFPAKQYARKALKRLLPFALAVFFFPTACCIYLGCGLLDVSRNKSINLSTFGRYFAGNGVFTWLLSPFNLMIDVLALPYWNKGIYELSDLPQPYQDEITSVIDAASKSNVVEQLESKLAGQARGMVFFKWYGTNCATSLTVPQFHQPYKYIRTIGVSVFNKKQSTTEHFGPLRVTLRVLYNINTIDDANVYIKVGNHVHHWNNNKLFIFDDTLQHQSCNESNALRHCLFVDILRPSLFPGLLSAILSAVRLLISRVNFVFYKNWTFIK